MLMSNQVRSKIIHVSVPRVIESQLKIDNLQYTPELANRNESEFKELAEILEREIKSALFQQNFLKYGPADIEVKVIGFT